MTQSTNRSSDGFPAVAATPDLRTTLGRFASGVVIVASRCEGRPVGLSVQSFASLSLDPALVSLSVSVTSTTWPSIVETGRFCASILAADQGGICRRFATSGADKFAGVAHTPGPLTGCPRIDGALAWVECGIAEVHRTGDHWLVVADVLGVEIEGDADLPLLFYRGEFASLRPAALTCSQPGRP